MTDPFLRSMVLPVWRRMALCLLVALAGGKSLAAGLWDCHRSADGKEWVCVTDKKKPSGPVEEEAAAKRPGTERKAAEEARRDYPVAPQQARREPPSEASKPPQIERPEPAREPEQPEWAEESVSPVEPARPSVPPPVAVPDVKQEEKPVPKKVDVVAAPGVKAAEEPKPGPPAVPSAELAAPAGPEAQAKSGWNCRPGPDRDWDCSLVGPDPRGEPHVVGKAGESTPDWSQAGDMTQEDEQRFSSLLARMPANPWTLSCGRRKFEWSPATDYFFLTEADRILREKSPLEINADSAELLHGESSSYQGSAEITRADQKLSGDLVTHNTLSGAMNAQGSVFYREKGLSFASDTAFMDIGKSQGILRNSQFILETVPARGTSRITHIDSKTQSRYETVTYTSCPPGNQDWLMHASNTTIDRETGEGVARNAWLEFKGVPFLYTPYLSFPIDDRRRSGFIAPHVGYSKINGFDLSLPYYFNLAPNYDLTLIPRVLEKRGELLRGDFRYLTTLGSGRVFGDILPWDRIREETRGQIAWRDRTRFDNHWNSYVDAHWVSDERYVYELGTLLGINSATNLRSWGQLNYSGGELFGGRYGASLMADYYQLLIPNATEASRPYARLPQLSFWYGREVADTGLQFSTSAEFARFDQPVKVNGERLNVRPKLYYPFQVPAGYVTPSLAVQHTEYWLGNLNPGESDTFSRIAPIFSLDSGLYLEREFTLSDIPLQQTLEPRLFYLWVPKVQQPYDYNCTSNSNCLGLNFDSSEYDFTFYQLFRENRFVGSDRLSDANQVTPALTSRIISQNSGLEKLRLSVGKVFYIKEPEVVLVPNGPQPTVKDNIVGEVSSMLSEHWTFRTTGQYNYEQARVDRGQVVLQYNNFANNLLNLSYRYRRDPFAGSVPPLPENPNYPRTVNQTDISTRLPFGEGWFAIGRWQYDLESQVTVQSVLGIERETCCWRFSLIGLRYANGALGPLVNPDNVTFNNSVFFQLELKGLGRFGDRVETFLAQNFSGYRRSYELP